MERDKVQIHLSAQTASPKHELRTVVWDASQLGGARRGRMLGKLPLMSLREVRMAVWRLWEVERAVMAVRAAVSHVRAALWSEAVHVQSTPVRERFCWRNWAVVGSALSVWRRRAEMAADSDPAEMVWWGKRVESRGERIGDGSMRRKGAEHMVG